VPAGWTLATSGTGCVATTNGVVVTPTAGAAVTCTFTNSVIGTPTPQTGGGGDTTTTTVPGATPTPASQAVEGGNAATSTTVSGSVSAASANQTGTSGTSGRSGSSGSSGSSGLAFTGSRSLDLALLAAALLATGLGILILTRRIRIRRAS